VTKRRAYFWATVCTLLIFGIAAFALKTVNLHEILPAQVVQPGFYKVTEVYDGDTIAVNMNGKTEKVRFIGVDTPETHKPNTPVQCYGPQASDYTKQLLTGKNVRLEADPTNQNRDRYGRLLRYVYTEQEVLVEQSLIEQGLGFAYLSFPFEKSPDFAAIQEQARADKRGLWLACQPTLEKGRWLSNSL
jgi:endonuclease YncB( thermonuclease family)